MTDTTQMPKKVCYEEHLELIVAGCPIPADTQTIKLFKGKQLFAYQKLALAKRDMEQFKICVEEIEIRLNIFDGLMERTALHFGGNA
ncbi:hypothetical protein M5X02_31620 [Paenibacillus alvei]|uniref:hypothetical protein n=1 Tax=Paenibacillus alvei TaxID=44250 RepID=UPI0002880D82|nr:hypothetical protein [Paenibacillus alvei]EJW13965.1 hypothetical protein PAV_141p00710 [Paenibacillus alvei DSM 29]MCY9545178.1 hypothetical protein [Paenibacillus alvei]MCY9707673.1 hypothetical protein [Paenibacillus alvei]MEC0082815.1 hypothetical protein [Paenibacillus alvei]